LEVLEGETDVAENALVAEDRTETGKGAARKLRAAGRIPAVLYGKGVETRALSVSPAELAAVLRASGAGMNTLIDLQVGGGGGETVLVKALDRDPVRGAYVHADFYKLDLAATVEVSVPLHFVGKAPGVELGGILDHPLREVDIECLPGAIPEHIEVDVSALALGDSVHVSELVLPGGVTVKTDPTLAVAAVVAPKAEEEEAPAEEAEAALEEAGEAAADAGSEAEKSEGGQG